MLEDKSMREFLLRILAISNSLASVGNPISLQEHIDATLEGLLQDYYSVISIIESKFQPLPIEEVEALLLAHEARLRNFRKHIFDLPLTIGKNPSLTSARDTAKIEYISGGNPHPIN